jgi:hypothetical protein
MHCVCVDTVQNSIVLKQVAFIVTTVLYRIKGFNKSPRDKFKKVFQLSRRSCNVCVRVRAS